MNGDGAITISDVFLWVKWLYFYPGDYVIAYTGNTFLGIFLEFDGNSFGGIGSGVISFFLWGSLFLPYAWWQEGKRDNYRTRVKAEDLIAQGERAMDESNYVSAYVSLCKAEGELWSSLSYMAIGSLRKRATKMRRQVTSKMTPDQIAKAKKLLASSY